MQSETEEEEWKIRTEEIVVVSFVEKWQVSEQLMEKLKRIRSISEQRSVQKEFLDFARTTDKEEVYQDYGNQKQKEFVKNIESVSEFIRIRGDGNCFYTALIYSYMREILLKKKEECILMKCLSEFKFTQINFGRFDIRFSSEELDRELPRLVKMIFRSVQDVQSLNYLFLHKNRSMSYEVLILYARTLAYQAYINLLSDAEFIDFSQSLDQGNSINEILEWEKECNENEVVVKAISKYLSVDIDLYLPRQLRTLAFQVEGSTAEGKVTLLFNPGHYQVIVTS